jgi:transcriptional coactivator HFI1/ADA1
LNWIIDPFLRGDPQREQLHNQLLLAVFANAQRDAPDQPGVASWVAANDKPTAQTKPVSGDEAERRLKSEIMLLPARERHRLKQLGEVSSLSLIFPQVLTIAQGYQRWLRLRNDGTAQ